MGPSRVICMTTTSTEPEARGPAPEVADVRDLDVDLVRAADPFALTAGLARLTGEDLAELTPDQAEVVVAATQRAINALSAIQAEAVVTFADRTDEELHDREQARLAEFRARREAAVEAGRPFTERWHPMPGRTSYAASALAPLLRIAPRTMATRVSRARQVVHHLAGVNALARSGDLEPYRVEAVARSAEILESTDLPEYEARVLDRDITDLPVSELTRRARRAAAATDRASVEEVAARARARRSVSCSPDRDVPGMTTWQLSLPSDVSRRLWEAVDALGREYRDARRHGDDPVTLDQARADALCDLVLERAQIETTVELVVPVAALMSDSLVPGSPTEAPPLGAAADAAAPVGSATDPAAHPGLFRLAARRTPSEILAGQGQGQTDPLILSWVSGEELGQASELEAAVALLLMDHLEVVGNPHLAHHPRDGLLPPERHLPSTVGPPDLLTTHLPPKPDPAGSPPRSTGSPPRMSWFVPGLVDAGRVGDLLPDDVLALLADPATRIRVAGSNPTTGAAATDATVAYRPAAPIARRVRRRDGTCRFPGCGTPADRCDLDHVVRWPEGPTTEANLVTLCRTHHGFKHHAGWRLEMTPLGICTWTAPTGREHTTGPHALHDLAT